MDFANNHTVFCVAENAARALNILHKLRYSGFDDLDISLMMANEDGAIKVEEHSKAPEGTTVGAGAGAIVGGALGWMAGIGALAIPGLGPFIAAGPILAALSGAAIFGTAGGLTGGLIGLGFSENDAKQYESYLRTGNTLISVVVKNDDEVSRATRIFEDANAKHMTVQDVSEVHSTGER